MAAGLLVMRTRLLIISCARIVVARLLVMAATPIAIADNRCARDAADDGANDGPFCTRTTARDLAADDSAEASANKAADNLVVAIGGLVLVMMLVIRIMGLRRERRERQRADGREGRCEMFDHGSYPFAIAKAPVPWPLSVGDALTKG